MLQSPVRCLQCIAAHQQAVSKKGNVSGFKGRREMAFRGVCGKRGFANKGVNGNAGGAAALDAQHELFRDGSFADLLQPG